MTVKQIKEYYKRVYGTREKIVDVNHYYYEKEEYVSIITISPNHVVYRCAFFIEDNRLNYINSEVF